MAKSLTSIEPGGLDELSRLRAVRDPIAGWLARLEDLRETVSEPVYRRVREDYAKRIADLDLQARPLRIAATRAIAELDGQLARLEVAKGEAEVDLQEVELRRFLEEYSAEEFEERARGARGRIAELEKELEEIRATRELWLAARGEEIAETAAPTPPAPPTVPTAPAPVATPAPPPAAAPAVTAPVETGLRPLSPASITMPRPMAPPRPSSPAIPLPSTADAAAHTVHLPSPPPVAPPPTPPLDRTVVYTPEPPSPAPATDGATQRLEAMLVPLEPGDSSAKGHVLAAANTIGRVSDNAIQVQHGSVSRHHALLRFTAEGWMLEDLNAENGTWVNGERIEKRLLLDGDRINIGTVRFFFRLG